MRSFLKTLVYTAFGGAVFWAPRHSLLAGAGCAGWSELAWILPLAAAAGLWTLVRLRHLGSRPLSIARCMVLGIWLFGPVCLSYRGGGYGGGWYGPQDLREWLNVARLTLQFPLATWQMANYDGSLVAVLFTTVCLPLLARRQEQGTRRKLSADRRETQDPADRFRFFRCPESGRWLPASSGAPVQTAED